MDPVIRAQNRFGLGARLGERASSGDPREWLRGQLAGGPPTLPSPAGATPAELGEAVRATRAGGQRAQRELQEARQRLARIAAAEARQTLAERVRTERPFVERLVAFWSNHLCVSSRGKVLVGSLAGSYEREAIRPHVLGRFADMVLASARHPAMLVYLDNFQSIGPASPGARLGGRVGMQRGLNENYARELLELHTLGVGGGYSQEDVLEVARILTGWTIAGVPGPGTTRLPGSRAIAGAQPPPEADGGPIRFLFRDLLHEPGARVVLGVRYPEGGYGQGERLIRDLCRHPSTARFIAGKLVRHFVADDPPPAAVERVTRVFLDSEGDLAATAAALIELPEAWDPESRKFRSPQDWLVATLRAFDVPVANDTFVALLQRLRQPLWSPPAPDGFPDTLRAWADSAALLDRAEVARTLGRRIAASRRDPRSLLGLIDVPAGDPLNSLLADRSIPPDERVALAIAGPAFQWR